VPGGYFQVWDVIQDIIVQNIDVISHITGIVIIIIIIVCLPDLPACLQDIFDFVTQSVKLLLAS